MLQLLEQQPLANPNHAIVQRGQPSYQMRPIFHVQEPQEARQICQHPRDDLFNPHHVLVFTYVYVHP